MESIEEKSGIVTAGSPGARVRVLLPGVGERDLFELAELLETMIAADGKTPADGEENAGASGRDFLLIGFPVEDWNRELSPWTAPPVFGSEPFSGCAGATLARITSFLSEDRVKNAAFSPEYLIAGYSLAGLFSLYAVSVSDVFSGAAAVSPSVWFPGWLDWSASHPPRCGHVYLSLGDREEKTKNPVLRTVGDAIRREKELLDSLGIPSVLEWNPGNHFTDCNLRLARGIRVALRASDVFPSEK